MADSDVWVPGWEIRRFTDPKSGAANANRVACAHTIVGGLPGAWDWGNRDGKPYPHSYIEGDGHGINAQPVNLRAAANLEGNPYCWAIETEDVDPKYFPAWNLTCGDVPAWTDAQLETLTEGMAWWCVRFNRPPVLIPDAKPGRVGLAYHRQGVPDSPEWVTGADQWTTSPGKCCPDWRRIHQFKTEVVPAVAALVNGDDMPLNDADKAIIRNIIRQELYGDEAGHTAGLKPIIRNEVRAMLHQELTTSGSETRVQVRELAKLGANDAEADNPPVA